MAGNHGPVKHLVKGGVDAAKVQATGLSNDKLRKMIRDMVESGIVRIHFRAKSEHLNGMDMDMLGRCARLLNDLESRIANDEPGKEPDLSKMSDEDVAKALK